jgi:hypothetical protein
MATSGVAEGEAGGPGEAGPGVSGDIPTDKISENPKSVSLAAEKIPEKNHVDEYPVGHEIETSDITIRRSGPDEWTVLKKLSEGEKILKTFPGAELEWVEEWCDLTLEEDAA